MLSKIDWLSFTVRRTVGEGDTERQAFEDALTNLEELWEDCYNALGMTHHWTWQKGRKPYRASYRSPDNGVAIFVHGNLDHVLFELSGKGCDQLARYEHAESFLDSIKHRLTRLDVAVDMETETTPGEFASHREPGRFKSFGIQHSESGDTCYIGSRSSSRYACVYRYNPPHERAHLLRSEFRLGKHDAENTARAIITDGIDSVVKALGDQFGWKHPDWKPDDKDPSILRAWRPERGKGKTMFWLADTVAPLLVRLHREGEIDINRWIEENVLSVLRDDQPYTPPF